jgi:transposase
VTSPSVTLKKSQNWLENEQRLSISIPAIDKFIRHKLGSRYKKKRWSPVSSSARMSLRAREQWQTRQQTCDLSKLVIPDEAGVTSDLIRRYGRALGGALCRDAVPTGHWQTLTLIAGLRADGLRLRGDQAMTGETFKEYLRSQRGPTLKPGDIVIFDNLSAHKVTEVQAIVAAHGATIQYLPPYSPDLNPIEQVFAKLKALLRQAAARTYETLWRTVGQLMDHFMPEYLNFFKNSGYVSD